MNHCKNCSCRKSSRGNFASVQRLQSSDSRGIICHAYSQSEVVQNCKLPCFTQRSPRAIGWQDIYRSCSPLWSHVGSSFGIHIRDSPSIYIYVNVCMRSIHSKFWWHYVQSTHRFTGAGCAPSISKMISFSWDSLLSCTRPCMENQLEKKARYFHHISMFGVGSNYN